MVYLWVTPFPLVVYANDVQNLYLVWIKMQANLNVVRFTSDESPECT